MTADRVVASAKKTFLRPVWVPKRMLAANTKPAARDALQWLQQDPQWAGVLQSVEQSRHIVQVLQRHIAPAMMMHLTPTLLRGDTLTLATGSAALAAKCRQLEPTLLAALRSAGLPVKQIRWHIGNSFRPTAAAQSPSQGATASPVLSALTPSATHAFDVLHQQLPDGPTKTAVEKLLQHHWQRRGSGHRPGG